jgi:hypothetical protein
MFSYLENLLCLMPKEEDCVVVHNFPCWMKRPVDKEVPCEQIFHPARRFGGTAEACTGRTSSATGKRSCCSWRCWRDCSRNGKQSTAVGPVMIRATAGHNIHPLSKGERNAERKTSVRVYSSWPKIPLSHGDVHERSGVSHISNSVNNTTGLAYSNRLESK